MILLPGPFTVILTVCVSTALFAVILAVVSDRAGFEMLGTTAAYTAVLVVFVGTTT
jgi:hypothetical protein